MIKTTQSQKLLLLFSAVSSFFILSWVIYYLPYGYDFSDESFYLSWISNPYQYKYSISMFGFIYHPFFVLFKGSIPIIRLVNLLFTFCLAWGLVSIFLNKNYKDLTVGFVPKCIISLAIATASLIFLRLWLPTPSYNWLAFQSLMLCTIGLLICEENINIQSIIGWLLIGVGGYLTFMAKPTTALALGLISTLYIFGSHKFNARLLFLSLTTALILLLITANLIDGSTGQFIFRIKETLRLESLLGAGHDFKSIMRIDSLHFNLRVYLIFILGSAWVFAASYFPQSENNKYKIIGQILLIGLSTILLLASISWSDKRLHANSYQQLIIWIIPLSCLYIAFAHYRSKEFLKLNRSQWSLLLTFLIFPHVFAFGTNNNYWWVGGLIGIFWVLAGLVILCTIADKQKLFAYLIPLAMAVQLVAIQIILYGIEKPYGQLQSLRQNSSKIAIRNAEPPLIISTSSAQYINEAVTLAKHAGYNQKIPMMDLTGHSHGLVYALGTSNLGEAYYPREWSGSERAAIEVLKNVSCQDLSSAWLLVENNATDTFSTNILSSFGANIKKDYQVIARFIRPKYADNIDEIEQQLLKPIRINSEAINKCVKKINEFKIQ